DFIPFCALSVAKGMGITMEKLLLCSMLVFVFTGPSTLVDAHPTKGEAVKRVYATSEQILLDMMWTSINRYVNDNYGHDVFWAEPRITDARLEAKSPNNWSYVVSLMIKVDDHSDQYQDFGLDQMTIKIDSSQYNNKRSSNGSNIHLVEYKKFVLPQRLNP
ncbi:hypothetical protein, partial [Cohnella sp.]|uniref:hypothetical protein n=1 Tax=Cohnella sp. TaxID=1883426 RepID=UPI0037043D55